MNIAHDADGGDLATVIALWAATCALLGTWWRRRTTRTRIR